MSNQRTSLKRCFPFRLGTTSYIIPGDIVTNVKCLAPRVDDIELVLFESDEISSLPDIQVLQMLQSVATKSDLTYTVHLPLDIQLGAECDEERCRSVDKCLRVITLVRCLKVLAFVVHLHEIPGTRRSSSGVESWQANLRESVRELLDEGIDPRTLCMETLDYPFKLVEDIVFEHDLSICLDIGHILRCGHPFLEYLDHYLSRSRVIHLHGVIGDRDHCDISAIAGERIAELLARLDGPSSGERVLTLEVFNENDLEKSMDVLKRFVK